MRRSPLNTKTPPLDRRTFLGASLTALGAGLLQPPVSGAAEQTLSNGIRLPSPWPPRLAEVSPEPMPVPYLQKPPAVLPIDLGRQLFVDDFLIEATTLARTYHLATYHPATPVLKPDRPWEQEGGPCAMPFSDGVWYDPQDKLFKIWYMGGYVRSTCYATSTDGIHWEKPALDVVPGTNVVQAEGRDSTTVWLDLDEKEAKRRYKLFRSWRTKESPTGWGLTVYFSADGIHWGERVATSSPCGDRTTVFYNPFVKKWVYSLRSDHRRLGRTRHYREHADVLAGTRWQEGETAVPWVGADSRDPQRTDLRIRPQLYNLDAVAYESLLLGLFSIWRGQPKDRAKPNEVCVGFSRDGFHWHRPDRRALVPVSEKYGDWNWGNVQSAGGCCLVVGDRLYFYVSGRAGQRGSPTSGVCTTGLAVLRRDGFASMDAGAGGGTLTTRPVTFRGRHLFVNAEVSGGELRAEVVEQDGKPISGLTADACVAIHGDGTLQRVGWQGGGDLARVAGRSVKIRFHLRQGKLYAFWVSPEVSGASHGYVAAGGPGYTGPTDTVGSGTRAT